MLENRLTKRFRHLKKWARRTGVQAFRIYDRDIPEIPLLLDLYGDAVVGALFERPYEKDEAEEILWLQAMSEGISRALSISSDRIFIKRRRRLRGRTQSANHEDNGEDGQEGPAEGGQYAKLSELGVRKTVEEGELRFSVNLSDYLDTGLFLDHRLTRGLVRAESSDKTVLNLFCYTGSFSVYANAGGAASVDSVDLSNTYLDWAADNLALNGFPAQRVDGPQFSLRMKREVPNVLIRADALRFIDAALGRGDRWDLIILDPPTFSNSKKMSAVLDLKRDYLKLVRDCATLLNPGGTLWFSTNAKGFRLDYKAIEPLVAEDYTDKTRDEDFQRRLDRVCYRIKRGAGTR